MTTPDPGAGRRRRLLLALAVLVALGVIAAGVALQAPGGGTAVQSDY
ncbi:MAG: hypothetical protein KDK12_02290 [Rhodobacteraceae bacterium]|nr:hypothetical protein [Paracoccaceae bacterium]